MKARTVYIVTDDDSQTVHRTPGGALDRFSRGGWSVVPPAYPDITVPLNQRNRAPVIHILEAEGYLEFTNGVTRINAAQLYED